MTPSLRYWHECSDCGFAGIFRFARREGEDYEDADSLGVLLDASCPACGETEPVLVPLEQFEEMESLGRRPL